MQCTRISSRREDITANFEFNFQNGARDYSTKVHDVKMKQSNVREKTILRNLISLCHFLKGLSPPHIV